MTNWKLKLGAVLVALAFLALPAAAASATLTSHHHTPWSSLVSLGMLLGGAVVVTYASFAPAAPFVTNASAIYTGGTVPPTVLQSSQVDAIAASIACSDADTVISFTHNWGLSAAAAAALSPQILNYVTVTGTAPPLLTFSVANTNVIAIGKTTATGSGCTFVVIAREPYSVSQ